jgi:hypothetical protein
VPGIWQESVVLLWVVVLVLAGVCLALVRQVADLTRARVASTPDPLDVDDGPSLGADVPLTRVSTVDGRIAEFGGEARRPTLVSFVSASCKTCETTPGHLRELRRAYPGDALGVVVVLRIAPEHAAGFVERHGLGDFDVVLMSHFPAELSPSDGMPFAFSLTSNGSVAARAAPDSIALYHQVVDRAVRYGPDDLERAAGHDSGAPSVPTQHSIERSYT